MDPSILGGANSTSKKKKNPPIPCFSADVVYKEIRTGGSCRSSAFLVAIFLRRGNWWKLICLSLSPAVRLSSPWVNPLWFNSNLQGCGIAVSAEDKGPWAIVAKSLKQWGLKSWKMVEFARTVNYWRSKHAVRRRFSSAFFSAVHIFLAHAVVANTRLDLFLRHPFCILMFRDRFSGSTKHDTVDVCDMFMFVNKLLIFERIVLPRILYTSLNPL